MAIELSKELKQRAVRSIREYFDEEWELEMGDLRAELVLEFFMKEIGVAVYNQAIQDAMSFLQDKLMDLDAVLSQIEE
jgi:uncharacterized protein (DUF2164 family)